MTMAPAINSILFPTDFSDNARNALPLALEIANRTGATLHVLHSIEEPYDFAPMAEEIKKGVTGKVRKLLDKLTEEIKNDNAYTNLTVKTHIQTGRTTYAILEEADSIGIDLVVMGTKGRSGLEKVFFGSTTAAVIQQSKVPVLAIPEKSEVTDIKQILFATDYNDGDMEALKYMTVFAGLFDAGIKIFNASLDNDLKSEVMFRGFRELVKEKISYNKIEFDRDTTITFFEAVVDQIEEHKISMLVMIRYDKPFALFKKKQSKDMSYYTQVPLFVIPGKTKE